VFGDAAVGGENFISYFVKGIVVSGGCVVFPVGLGDEVPQPVIGICF
jgi:hypothetical protein